jgi:excisionase family DNA binding protein
MSEETRRPASADPAFDHLLSVREVARMLGVSENTVRGWARSGHLPGCRLGGIPIWRFRPADIERYLNNNR